MCVCSECTCMYVVCNYTYIYSEGSGFTITHVDTHTHTHTHTHHRITGYSPFQGETHQETFLNVSMCDYDFDDELFDQVSTEAKEFIEKLLIQQPK